jgi:hypothetical protein
VGRACSICTHEVRGDIEHQVLLGASLRTIAGQFEVSRSALGRHVNNHIGAVILEAQIRATDQRASDLMLDARGLLARTAELLDEAERSGDHRLRLASIREARACLELVAKFEPTPHVDEEDSQAPVVGSDAYWQHVAVLMWDELKNWPTAALKIAERVDSFGDEYLMRVLREAVPEMMWVARRPDPDDPLPEGIGY